MRAGTAQTYLIGIEHDFEDDVALVLAFGRSVQTGKGRHGQLEELFAQGVFEAGLAVV